MEVAEPRAGVAVARFTLLVVGWTLEGLVVGTVVKGEVVQGDAGRVARSLVLDFNYNLNTNISKNKTTNY